MLKEVKFKKQNGLRRFSKRLFDLLLSVLGLLFVSPLFLVAAISIKLTSNGPVFFKQTRVGLNGKPFKIYKFRTMVVDAEKLGRQITVGEDSRVTSSGKILRKYKIDELPQLINVLKGEMSFVGPRPEVPKYVALYTDEQREVLKVKPGITDIASIEYRNESELLGEAKEPERLYVEEIMPHKIHLNNKYINHNNLWVDIKVILKTIGILFK